MMQPVDPTDAPFEPEIDMSKPWVTVDPEASAPSVEAVKNISNAMAKIPAEKRQKMGFSIHDMLHDCTWNGRMCSARFVQYSHCFFQGWR